MGAADRGVFIDQSQSFNVHMVNSNYGKLTSMHFYAWKKGLKTGMYYLRSQAAVDAIKFTVDQQALRESNNKKASEENHGSRPGSRPGSRHNSPNKQKSPNKPNGFRHNKKVEMNGNSHANGSPSKAQDIDEWRLQREKQKEAMLCSLNNKDECVSCGS